MVQQWSMVRNTLFPNHDAPPVHLTSVTHGNALKYSFVALDNLVNLVSLCVDRKKSLKAANQVLLISDGKDISTTQLLKKVRQVFNCGSHSVTKAWLLPVPVCILVFFAKALGKADIARRLFGSLQIDSSKTHELLGWKPVVNMDEQLAKMSKDF